MGLQEWVVNFRALHLRAKDGMLDASELERYHAAREELAQALLAAQRITVKPGETARALLRVPRAMQADITVTGCKQRAMTLDISSGGFSAMLGIGLPMNERNEVTLKMPAGGDPLTCEAKVTGVKRQGGTYRVSFEFHKLQPADADRFGFLVFDTALDSLKR